METLFIVSDQYQVIQAVEWACRNNCYIHMFCTNLHLQLNSTDKVKVYHIFAGDIFRSQDNVVNTLLGPDQQEYFRMLYSGKVEIHIFQDVDVFFKQGLLDVHLHELGDSSYKVNHLSGLYGEDDPFTVAELHLTQQPEECTPERLARVECNNIFSNMSDVCKKHIAKVLNVQIPEVPDNTLLYVHNEPDTDYYSAQEILLVHSKVNTLLLDMKKLGYTLWVKDHHKRPGGIDLSVADYVVECPVELLDTAKFARVLAVRSKCLEHINGKCYNALTLQAVTKSRNSPYTIYCRGVEKIYKNVL